MSPVQVVAATDVAAASSPENVGPTPSARWRTVHAKRLLLLLGFTAAAWAFLVLLGSSRADATPAPRPLGPASQSVTGITTTLDQIRAHVAGAVQQTRATVNAQVPRVTPSARPASPRAPHPVATTNRVTAAATTGVVRSVTHAVTTTVSHTTQAAATATTKTPLAPVTKGLSHTVTATLGTVRHVVDTTTKPVTTSLDEILPTVLPHPITGVSDVVPAAVTPEPSAVPAHSSPARVLATLPTAHATSTPTLVSTRSDSSVDASAIGTADRAAITPAAFTSNLPHRSGAGHEPSAPVVPITPVGPTAPDGVSVNAPAPAAATVEFGAHVLRPFVLAASPARDLLLSTRGTDDEPGFSPD